VTADLTSLYCAFAYIYISRSDLKHTEGGGKRENQEKCLLNTQTRTSKMKKEAKHNKGRERETQSEENDGQYATLFLRDVYIYIYMLDMR
jgi:hypothetical protein